ncbi:sensor histidine kinase [Levilactobacillus sp. N40-8-2]|uniref:sensor histidine kinase n=1 Tax=Levilactobacillus muriae TaxID=3238987 RepID=UPI0038B3C9D8
MAKPQTTAREIHKRVIRLLIIATLLMGTAIITVVGFQQIHQTQQSATRLMKGLQHSVIDDQPDWHWWRRYSAINTFETNVRVTNPRASSVKYYYSPFTRDFLSYKSHKMFGTNAISYTQGYGLTYYRKSYYHGNRLEIWLNLMPIVATLLSVIVVVLLVMAATILIGGVYVRSLARQLTQPLASLNTAAQEQAQQRERRIALPVPVKPVEVNQLAESFNALLETVNAHTTQERQFTSNAAHELRTPIAAVLTQVQLLQRRATEHPEIVPQSLAYISEESIRMKNLVDSLLTLSRADRAVLKLVPIDLQDVIAAVAIRERPLLHQSLTITGTQSAAVVLGAAESLEQVLTALLDNAAKYSPATSTITVDLETTATIHRIYVKDEGMGISAADKSHVFERFYRADAARTPEIAGTGLGLAIVEQLVHLNHGSIDVIDNVPRGSQFVVTLPRADDQSEKISE